MLMLNQILKTIMKRYVVIPVLALLMFATFTGCDDFLNADSGRYVAEEDYRLQTSGDTIFSMFGLFTQMQKLADSYVLLGELRADLLEVTDDSDVFLREINNLDVSENNIYVNVRNYYAVINNCNYILAHLDTSKIDKGQRFQHRQYAAVQAIRAWTYMQLALNFKNVKYYKHPILTVEDAYKPFEVLDFQALAGRLITVLEPLQEVPYPQLGFVNSYNTMFSLIPVKLVLGDLYLWTGEYEKAATAYRGLLYDRRVVVDRNNSSAWIPVNNTISPNANLHWQRAFGFNSGEVISSILCSTEYGQDYFLDTLNNQHKFKASAIALNNWKSQVYYLNEASNANGDLRMFGSVSYNEETNRQITTNFSFSGIRSDKSLIYKYKMYDQRVIIYRSSLVYLRYAEAVNRLEKPMLAMAVLRSGLNTMNLFDERIVPARERPAPLPPYMQFNDIRFQNNAGIRMRGLGNAQNDTTFYRFPRQESMMDSIRFVEDLIQQELALETAFEGNRFHDLMRITMRRMQDAGYNSDESYLADKVAAKHSNAAIIRNKLMNRDNWYIRSSANN